LVAFLRAINVGGHTVTMASLRGHFESLGFAGVETFIASGNVVFRSRAGRVDLLERRIEARLLAQLGYEVKTFVRTAAELGAIARYQPFPEAHRRTARSFNVGFLSAPLGAAARKALLGLKTAIDDFHAHGREAYWLCQRQQHESTFSNMRFERVVKARTTFRGMNTVARLVAKYGMA
jgi:uncharacterized protein (DUF1697 family)